MRGVGAGEPRGIAINFGGGLRAHETTRARPNAQVEPGFIAGYQAAAEIAGVGPDALAARNGVSSFNGLVALEEVAVLSPKTSSTSR